MIRKQYRVNRCVLHSFSPLNITESPTLPEISRYLTISSPHPRHQHRADWCHQRYHLAPCTPKPHTSWSGRTTAERVMPSFLLKGIEFSLIEMLVKLPNIRNSLRSAFGTVYSAGNEGISFVSLQFNFRNAVRLNGNMDEHGNKRLYDAQDPGFARLLRHLQVYKTTGTQQILLLQWLDPRRFQSRQKLLA